MLPHDQFNKQLPAHPWSVSPQTSSIKQIYSLMFRSVKTQTEERARMMLKSLKNFTIIS